MDTGSFAPDLPAVSELAQRRLATRYSSERAEQPMIPKSLSEDKLTFTHGEDRPAITFSIPVDEAGNPGALTVAREVMRADVLSLAEVDLIPDATSDEMRSPVHDLGHVASLLFWGRHHDQPIAMEDEEGHLGAQEFSMARFIVQETMNLTNKVVGAYLAEQDIPAIYRRHDLSIRTREALAGHYLRAEIERQYARADYTRIRGSRHLGLAATNVARVTSPLRRFSDFVDHANLAAHLDGRPFPFEEQDIAGIVAQYNRFEASGSSQVQIPKEALFAGSVRSKLASGTLANAEHAQLFFGHVIGREQEVAELRRDAVVHLLDKGAQARSVIEIALQRGLVHIVVAEDKQTFLMDADGKKVPYIVPGTTAKRSPKIAYSSLQVLNERSGLPMDYEHIKRTLDRAEVLKDGQTFLLSLARKLHAPYKLDVTQNEDGTFACVVAMRFRGKTRELSATAESAEAAKRQATSTFITTFNLFDNPPKAPLSLRKIRNDISKNAKAHPVVMVKGFADKRDMQMVVEYTTEQGGRFRDFNTCQLNLVDGDGQVVHAITAEASSRNDAKILAAAYLARELGLQPPPPKKSK